MVYKRLCKVPHVFGGFGPAGWKFISESPSRLNAVI